MTRSEIEVLATLLANGGEMSGVDLGYMLSRSRRPIDRGSAYEAGRRRTAPLVAGGAVRKPSPGRYAITEKGRIAAALAMARDPALGDALRDGD